MEPSLNHNSSARKKLLEYEDTIRREESQSNGGGYLGRTLSREHSKFMETILREGLEREESDRIMKREYSTKGYNSNNSKNEFNTVNNLNSSISKTPSSASGKRLDLEMASLNTSKFKPLMTSRSNQFNNSNEIRIENDENSSAAGENQNNTINHTIPQFFNDTDEVRSARQQELLEAKRIKFEFNFLSYLIELVIAYGAFIGILYLIKAASFPYFELILIFALTLTIRPYKSSTFVLIMGTAVPIIITNRYIGMESLTYLEILICYLSITIFNQKHKTKLIFILVIGAEIFFGFSVLPNIYQVLKATNGIYYYLFPLFMFILRNFIQFNYWILGHSELLFLQSTLFLIGLEYGTILTVSIGEIEFWYLIVFFTLQTMNDRTHFFLKLMIKLVRFCNPKMRTTPTPDSKNRNNHILSAHWNGFSSLNSFHLVGCIYIFTQLPLYASPYPSTFNLSEYTTTESYKPIVIWALVSVYEIMCLILLRNKQNVLLIGYTNNRWYMTIIRGIVSILGLWWFYVGLGVGLYCVKRIV